MQKRGQATFFIIIGLVVVVIVVLLYLLIISVGRNNVANEERGVIYSSDVLEAVDSDIRNCMEKSGNEAVDLVYAYGGYIDEDVHSVHVKERTINLLCYNESDGMINNFLDENSVEKNIANYVLNQVLNCVDFSSYRKQGFSINEEIPTVDSEIFNDNVIISLNWPIEIKREDFSGSIDNFSISIDTGFGSLYNIARDFVNEEVTGEFAGDEFVSYRLDSDPNIYLERDTTTASLSIYNLTYHKEPKSLYFGCRRSE